MTTLSPGLTSCEAALAIRIFHRDSAPDADSSASSAGAVGNSFCAIAHFFQFAAFVKFMISRRAVAGEIPRRSTTFSTAQSPIVRAFPGGFDVFVLQSELFR